MVIPYHDTAVLRTTGNDVVIVRTKLNVQDWACVAAHSGVGHVDTPCLQRETSKRMLNTTLNIQNYYIQYRTRNKAAPRSKNGQE